MAQHRSSRQKNQARESQRTIQLPIPTLGVLLDARTAFHELCIETGCEVLKSMMEVDREAICGVKGRHDTERRAVRGGSTPSRITLGGRQIPLSRLRVRSASGEVPLASFTWAASVDPLNTHTLEAIASGVSTRGYGRTLDPLPPTMADSATSKSAVSRRFVVLSQKRFTAFLSRPLEDLDVRIVMIDGKVFKKHCIVVALGIARDGKKHVLGLREGSTENSRMVTDLLTDLVDRGLSNERAVLFVIDGAKALRKAIRDVFGDDHGVVQRCQAHKLRNVLDYLPDDMRASVERAMKQAWNAESADLAQRQLRRLANSLDREYPSAAASVREGLEETLTVQRLVVNDALRRMLRTTNTIENLNGSIAIYTRNVKRWRGGSMIQRWVASALVEAEAKFRRVRGYRDLQELDRALDKLSEIETENTKVA